MAYYCRFLTSFGRFDPNYPTEGAMPFQRLPRVEIAIDTLSYKHRTRIEWQNHKGVSMEQWWPCSKNQVKRRGSVIVAEVERKFTALPAIIVFEIVYIGGP